LVEKALQADRAAQRAKAAAEDIFDQAEKQMSAELAREGCKKAMHLWELHEKPYAKRRWSRRLVIDLRLRASSA
jgi:hypothetical protein